MNDNALNKLAHAIPDIFPWKENADHGSLISAAIVLLQFMLFDQTPPCKLCR